MSLGNPREFSMGHVYCSVVLFGWISTLVLRLLLAFEHLSLWFPWLLALCPATCTIHSKVLWHVCFTHVVVLAWLSAFCLLLLWLLFVFTNMLCLSPDRHQQQQYGYCQLFRFRQFFRVTVILFAVSANTATGGSARGVWGQVPASDQFNQIRCVSAC